MVQEDRVIRSREGTAQRAAQGRLRILFLTAHPGISGPLPKLAPLMTDGLRRLGCQVATSPWSHRRPQESLLEKVAGRVRDIRAARRLLRSRPFDVMLITTTHDWPALLRDLPLLLLTRGMCGARIVQLHGSMVDRLVRPGHPLMKLWSRLLVRQCDAVLVLSEEERSGWLRFAPRATVEVVVNPFVPPSGAVEIGRCKSEPPVLLFVGRLIKEKGVFDLVQALGLVIEERPCSLVIAGKGPAEEEVRRCVRAMGLQAYVDLAGYVAGDDLWDLYASSAVFVLPTYFGEGFPTVIAEAMSVGLPVVTTPVRGSADLLTERDNVLFVGPRDPAGLARALLRLLNDPGLAAGMGRRNRDKVLQFAPAAVVPRYVEIMRSVLR
jgi:glycosyltransferase involved in cell wall biosynthesis